MLLVRPALQPVRFLHDDDTHKGVGSVIDS
jgi:hypothetical protein